MSTSHSYLEVLNPAILRARTLSLSSDKPVLILQPQSRRHSLRPQAQKAGNAENVEALHSPERFATLPNAYIVLLTALDICQTTTRSRRGGSEKERPKQCIIAHRHRVTPKNAREDDRETLGRRDDRLLDKVEWRGGWPIADSHGWLPHPPAYTQPSIH